MKKKSILLFCTTLIAGTFSFWGCGGTDPKPHHTVKQETKDYCVFQNNTRWIYEDESTALIDTLTLYNFEVNIADFEDRQYTNDIYVYMLKSSILGSGINDFYRFFVYPELMYGVGENVCASAGPATLGLQPIEYFDASDTGTVFVQYANTNGIKYAAYHDSLEIEGKYYYQVKVFEHLTKMGDAYPHKIYWSKHIGRIRYELFNGEVWNLINYKIKQ